jgi:hypothetical protein
MGGFLLASIFSASAGEAKILPGAVIEFKAKTAACMSREHLQEYKAQTIRGDKKKIQALFFESGGQGCVMVNPGKKFKVLSVDYNPGSSIGILEIKAVEAVGSAGSWAFSEGAVTK